MTESQRLPKWLLPSILLTALLCSYSVYKRYEKESLNKATSLAAEYDTVEALAAATGVPLPNALVTLESKGVNAIVITEDTVGEMIYEGRATVREGSIHASDDEAKVRIIRGLTNRFPEHKFAAVPDGAAGSSTIPVSGLSMLLVRGTSIGLDPRKAAQVRAVDMAIVARCSNSPGVTPYYIYQTLNWAVDLGATVFLPEGDQVLGRRDSVDDLVETLREKEMLYASPEFAKIGGDEEVVRELSKSEEDRAGSEAMKPLVIRLHSAQSAELDKMPLADAVDRYARATRERNMRMLLIRPWSFAGGSAISSRSAKSVTPLDGFADFVGRIYKQILKEGGSVGKAKPFEDSEVPKWLFLLIGVSVVPTGFYVGSVVFAHRTIRLAGAALLGLLALSTCTTHSGPLLMAFAAAIIFPMAAFMILDQRQGKNALLEFLVVSFVSLVGGLVVAGLLNGIVFFVRAEQFPGVKLAVFLPIAAVAAYFFWRLADPKETLRSPITWGAALVGILLLAALAFMISRTGNDNPAGVSDFELRFRNVLDALLVVRPRTKEFLVGHPLLVLGIGMLLWQRRTGNRKYGGWIALALAGGAIGQTDVVNTLCHLHTPITLSLLRIGVGLVAGCIIGLVLWAVVKRFLPLGEGS